MQQNILEIHQTRSFKKQLRALYRAGKKERDIAQRAERLIGQLQLDPLDERAASRRTYHGEFRLRDCRKYNLSCGFRLVSLKRDKRLIFTSIGSHDACQQWIENNREYQEEIESFLIPMQQVAEADVAQPEEALDEYEEQLLMQANDQLLREIFSGLCR